MTYDLLLIRLKINQYSCVFIALVGDTKTNQEAAPWLVNALLSMWSGVLPMWSQLSHATCFFYRLYTLQIFAINFFLIVLFEWKMEVVTYGTCEEWRILLLIYLSPTNFSLLTLFVKYFNWMWWDVCHLDICILFKGHDLSHAYSQK